MVTTLLICALKVVAFLIVVAAIKYVVKLLVFLYKRFFPRP